MIARHPIGKFNKAQGSINETYFFKIVFMIIDTMRIYTNLIDPFDGILWTCYGVSIWTLTVVTIAITWTYKHKVCSTIVRPDCSLQFLTMRMLFGVTEPDRIVIFSAANHLTGSYTTV